MIVSKQQAWKLAQEFGKLPPNRGYAFKLGGGLVLSHTKGGKFVVIDFPVTAEKVAKFESENREFIESLPQPDPMPLLARIRKQFFERPEDSTVIGLESAMRLEKAGKIDEVVKIANQPLTHAENLLKGEKE